MTQLESHLPSLIFFCLILHLPSPSIHQQQPSPDAAVSYWGHRAVPLWPDAVSPGPWVSSPEGHRNMQPEKTGQGSIMAASVQISLNYTSGDTNRTHSVLTYREWHGKFSKLSRKSREEHLIVSKKIICAGFKSVSLQFGQKEVGKTETAWGRKWVCKSKCARELKTRF